MDASINDAKHQLKLSLTETTSFERLRRPHLSQPTSKTRFLPISFNQDREALVYASTGTEEVVLFSSLENILETVNRKPLLANIGNSTERPQCPLDIQHI